MCSAHFEMGGGEDCGGIKVANGEIMKLSDDDGYKYLGILGLDNILHRKVKN